ncbi:MAG: MEKHLA domain-containing protein [Pseudomonadota bacterium]
MRIAPEAPSSTNSWRLDHAKLITDSFIRFTGDHLLDHGIAMDCGETLYHAPFVVLSHGTETDPIFNYANLTAQRLFEFPWEDFVQIPSRRSAEPLEQIGREHFMNKVRQNGFVADYQGVRISSSGKRFRIANAVVWNLIDDDERLRGQAAAFDTWQYLSTQTGPVK